MSALIEVDATTGQAAFMSANLTPWHRLGTVTIGAQTPEAALNIAHLANWNIRLVPLQTTPVITAEVLDDDGYTPASTLPSLVVPNNFAVIRDNPFRAGQRDVLGVVGNRYTCFQNEALVEFLTNLIEESGAVIETAGSIDNGAKVFFSMKLPKSVLIGGRDLSDHYITILAGHDGLWAVRVLVTTVRVVCSNTWNAALNNKTAQCIIRHTASINSRMDSARKVLGIAWKGLSEFDQQMQALVEREMTRQMFNELITEVWPVKPTTTTTTSTTSTRGATIAANRVDALNALFSGPTNSEIAGTALDGLMAITEYLDHHGKDPAVNAHRVATSAVIQETKELALAKLLG